MKKCPFCGAENPASAFFCEQCQKPLSATKSAAITKTKSKLPLFIGGAIVIVLAISVYFTFFTAAHSTAPKPVRSTKANPNKIVVRKSASSSAVTNVKSKGSSVSAQANFNADKIKTDIQTTVGTISGLTSVYVAPTTGSQQVVIDNQQQRAASSIKLFILAAAYSQVNRGQLNLSELHTLSSAEIVGGTGLVQNMAVGTQLSYQDLLTRMIQDSDNTATNIVIDKLGGLNVVNQVAAQLGAKDTQLQRKMLDTQTLAAGKDNLTTVQDIGNLLTKLYKHQLISKPADDAMLGILATTKNHSKLPQSLPAGTTVYNKTGEYPDYGVQNDAAIIKNEKGAFVVVVLAQNGVESQQVTAMNKLGALLYQDILAD
ncbi:serine hydrolase [Loigolactobacillus zhaoyuanensis]|uniref:Serine hydrolase n=1 Tax=Loigolactobacillus zhaoyuanensis TaxID=2486017 RepID=A0ABW8UCE3_9LACO|nr:serine hydrolase [Loigolactobacillus zhaoyuanensis]